MMENRNYYAIIPANVRYDKDLTSNAKLLYAEITALCNQEGYCWANNSYFSQLYGVDIRTIQRWIETLVKKEYISVKMIEKEGTKSIEKRMIFITEKVVTKMSLGGDKNVMGGGDKNVMGGGDKNVTHNNKYINNIYISNKDMDINKDSINKKDSINNKELKEKIYKKEKFEEFWNSYPRKDNRKKAEEKFNKICSNQKTFEKIMNSLEFQKQNVFSKEKKYIPHAITWLNQERYNDEFDLPSQQPKELTPLDEEYYQNDLDF